jgi:hypothetical protein
MHIQCFTGIAAVGGKRRATSTQAINCAVTYDFHTEIHRNQAANTDVTKQLWRRNPANIWELLHTKNGQTADAVAIR